MGLAGHAEIMASKQPMEFTNFYGALIVNTYIILMQDIFTCILFCYFHFYTCKGLTKHKGYK